MRRESENERPSGTPPVVSGEWTLGARPAEPASQLAGAQREAASPASDLFRYWEIARANRRLVLGVFAVVFGGVVAGTLLQTPIYRAMGAIEIRREAADAATIQGMFETATVSEQHLLTQYEILRSPRLARSVVEELDLHHRPEFNPSVGAVDGAPPETQVQRAGNLVRDRLIIDPVDGSRVVNIGFESQDPELAARVVNTVVDRYVDIRYGVGAEAVTRLTAQADDAQAQLFEAEARLAEFVDTQDLDIVENAGGVAENAADERIRQLNEQLTRAIADRIQVEARYDLVRRGRFDALDDEVVRSLRVSAAELTREYAQLRATFTDSFPRVAQVRQQLEQVESRLERERERLARAVQSEYRAALRHEEMLRDRLVAERDSLALVASAAARYRVLRQDVQSYSQLYADLLQKKKEAQVAAAIAASEVAVLDRAVPPMGPVRPQPKRTIPLGAAAGLLFGVAAAFVREYVRTAQRESGGSIKAYGVPVLGVIPAEYPPNLVREGAHRGVSLPSGRNGSASRTRVWHRIDTTWWPTPFAEAFRRLRASILAGRASELRTLLVTSAATGDGKTTVAANLALALAGMHRRVLLVDANFIDPAVHHVFDVEPTPGLADALGTGRDDWRDLVREGVSRGLDVLPAGRANGAPADLLDSNGFRMFVAQARRQYDFVVLDSPSLHVNAGDVRLIAPVVDSTVLVVRLGATSPVKVQWIIDQVPNVDGVVLNDAEARITPWASAQPGERPVGVPV